MNTQLSLETFSKMMPGVFLWKKNIDSIYTEVNTNCAELFGINNKRDISGFTDSEIPCKISEFAELFRQQDNQVITTGRPLKILEVHNCSKNQLKIMLNTKNPLRDENNIIIGTFAYCIDITNEIDLVKKLLSSVNRNLFSNKETKLTRGSYILSHNNTILPSTPSLPQVLEGNLISDNDFVNGNTNELTPRQLECAILYVKGFTIKEIGKILKLSPRTVGHYIENIKDKYQCSKKHELISCLLKLNAIKAKI